MLTDKCLVLEVEHFTFPESGKQKLYLLPNGYGLSVVNSPELHHYKFAWEVAILKNFIFETKNKYTFELDYDTELTNDAEVFSSDRDTNKFILKALKILGKL